jgi:hypothetical protein
LSSPGSRRAFFGCLGAGCAEFETKILIFCLLGMGAIVDYTVWKRALIAAAGLIVDRADSMRHSCFFQARPRSLPGVPARCSENRPEKLIG